MYMIPMNWFWENSGLVKKCSMLSSHSHPKVNYVVHWKRFTFTPDTSDSWGIAITGSLTYILDLSWYFVLFGRALAGSEIINIPRHGF